MNKQGKATSSVKPQSLNDLSADFAEHYLQEHGELNFMCVLHLPDGHILPVMSAFSDAEEKSLLLQTLAIAMRVEKVVAYTVMSEVWMSIPADPAQAERIRPSEDPDRTEGVMTITVAGEAVDSRFRQIERDADGKIVALLENDFPAAFDVRGPMTELMREDMEISPQIEAAYRQHVAPALRAQARGALAQWSQPSPPN